MTAPTSASGRAARLRPDDVLRYLAATGWRRGRDYGRGQIWELDPPPGVANPHPYEVLVPLDQRLRDYPLRMTDLLETVANAGWSLEKAVALANGLAQPGDIVLFSPGTSSFDMFKNYADRGNQFRALVQALPE